MGEPRFAWEAIPLADAMTRRMPVGWSGLEAPAAVNVGNPHIVFFVDNADAVDLGLIGPEIETRPTVPRAGQRQCRPSMTAISHAADVGTRRGPHPRMRHRRVRHRRSPPQARPTRRPVLLNLPGGELILAEGADGRSADGRPAPPTSSRARTDAVSGPESSPSAAVSTSPRARRCAVLGRRRKTWS